MSFLKQAFEKVCSEAKLAEGFYVSLMERVPFYIGPAEGGTWGDDILVVAYQHFASKEQADAVAIEVMQLAKEEQTEARKSWQKQCEKEMDWLEARGLESDYLPETDGHSEYFVSVSEKIPENVYGCRQYS